MKYLDNIDTKVSREVITFRRYQIVHKWLRYHFGKADRCENDLCEYPRKNASGKTMLRPKMYQWALKRGVIYEKKRENFMMMCVNCHVSYDKIDKIKIPLWERRSPKITNYQELFSEWFKARQIEKNNI